MNEVTAWLNMPEKDYRAGVEIYSRHKISNKHDTFFAGNPDGIHMQMLDIQLRKIARKLGEVVLDPIPEKKPIKVAPLAGKPEAPADLDSMRGNLQFVNKLLVMKWEDLSAAEQEMFFNNPEYHRAKYDALVQAGKLRDEMHSMDAKRKATKIRSERKKFNERFNAISKQIRDLFKKKIDTWNDPAMEISKVGKDDVKIAIERERRIRYLKGTALPRAKKELQGDKLSEKMRDDRVKNIAEWETELKELEKIHQL